MKPAKQLAETPQLSGGLTVPAQLPTSGSATGNPRNKVALKPGYSLMDWIRLSKSGKDLAGTGGRITDVTPQELRKHNSRSDAWMALNGRVYNVTSYMDYHPGGWDELIRGAGRDATKLFNETHSWVNFESMLSACLVGRLTSDRKPSFTWPFVNTQVAPVAVSTVAGRTSQKPHHDFHQTDSHVVVSIYTKFKEEEVRRAFRDENVIVDLPVDNVEQTLHVLMYLPEEGRGNLTFYQLRYKLAWKAVEKPVVVVNQKSGKVEIKLTKDGSFRCASLGRPLPGNDTLLDGSEPPSFGQFRNWILVEKKAATHDCNRYVFEPESKLLFFKVPSGHHVVLKAEVEPDIWVERKYTPVSRESDFPHELCDDGNRLHFLIKTYANGTFTPYLDKVEVGQTVSISNHEGKFKSSRLTNNVQHLLLLAAGTGLTPMIRIIQHFYHLISASRSIPATLTLLFFNKSISDILCKDMLEKLKDLQTDKLAVKVVHILSQQQSEGCEFGRVSSKLLQNVVPAAVSESHRKLCCVCGPIPFTKEARRLCVQDLNFDESNLFVFEG